MNLQSLIEQVKDFFTGNRRQAAFVTTILVAMTLTAVIVLCVQAGHKEKIKPSTERLLTADQKLIVPEGPSVPSGYTLSRTPRKKWEAKEAERWFTSPGKKEIDALSRANDSIVSDITGAAP